MDEVRDGRARVREREREEKLYSTVEFSNAFSTWDFDANLLWEFRLQFRESEKFRYQKNA